MKVFIPEAIHPAGLVFLTKNGVEVFETKDIFDPAEVDGIIVRSVYQINSITAQKFKHLKFVAKLGTGLDNIDQEYCLKQGIEVFSAPGMNAVSTAEFIVMQILNIYKNIFAISDAVKNKDFRRKLYFGRELSDKCIGIIGYGSVGKNVATMISPLVQRVNIYSRTQKCDLQVHNLHFVENIDGFLRQADVVILAVNLKGNEFMVNKSFLEKLKTNVILVNMARGGLVDEKALAAFLKSHEQTIYCCDVLTHEPDYTKAPEEQDYDNELLGLQNVIYTPHIAGMTEECQRRIALDIAQKILATKKVDIR